ncbi:MAG: cell division protein FtsQ/DivIB [Sphingomonadales bacterium]
MRTLETPRQKATPRREAARSFGRRRRMDVLRRGALALTLVALALTGATMWKLGMIEDWRDHGLAEIEQAGRQAGLVIEHVFVTGRKRAARDTVSAAVGAERGSPIFAIDLTAARGRLESLGWVRRATVRRQLPDTIIVQLQERGPFALWQHKGRTRLIDAAGVVITDKGLSEFSALPLVVGENAPAHAGELVTVLERQPELFDRVRAAVWVGDRRWKLRFDNGVTVDLPERDAAAAWDRLAGLEQERGLLEGDITAIDMRLADRLTVRLAPGAARRLRIGRQST